MGKSTRRKGVKGEGEVRMILEAAGLTLRGLEGRGDWLAFGNHAPALHVEVKRQERVQLPMWLRQAAAEAPGATIPVVAFRQNEGEWYAAMRLTDLAGLMMRWEE